MRFTSENLMKAMGLNVGDRVKVYNRIYELKKTYNGYFFDVVDKEIHKPNLRCSLTELLNEDYEILPRPKRVGDLKCGSEQCFECANCPLRWICDTLERRIRIDHDTTIYDVLESFEIMDADIYNLLKAKLDKEV